MKLCVATHNRHKLDEIKKIFSVPALELVSMDEYPDLEPVEEDGDTFMANAIKKAAILAIKTRMWAIADDSGLEVDALGGEPGVRSARYAGEPIDCEANNVKLLDAMKDIKDRVARFRCAVALSSPGGRCQVVEGKCEGLITEEPRGSNGFGYDPLFVPSGNKKTFAEMEGESKNIISHRGAALRLAREKWGEVLGQDLSDWPKAEWM